MSSFDPSREAHNPELLLYGLQSPINIGMILRIAESYQIGVWIYDQFRVMDDAERTRTMTDFACGAIGRRGYRALSDANAIRHVARDRRLIATSIISTGSLLPDFEFRSGDMLVLGNEYDGLPDEFVARADVSLHIPMPAVWTPKPKAEKPIDPTRVTGVARDGQPNLNVAMTAGILCYAAYVSRLAHRPAVQASALAATQDA
jgi:tRNA G18 (ribose-2'-O)-methylase SpoU